MNTRKAIDLSPDRYWTVTSDMLLMQLITERLTLPDICAVLNRSEASVRKRVSLLRQNETRQQQIIKRMDRTGEGNTAWSKFHGVRTGRINFR